jgi:hypothetical protein
MTAMAKSRFELAERTQLRGRLLRYMEENGIGSPALQSRIAEASGRSLDLIPLKTLQRFLVGQGRTNDGMLILIAQFADKLPDEDRVEEFVAASSLFFGMNIVDARPVGTGADQKSLVGSYAIFEGVAPPAGFERGGVSLSIYTADSPSQEFTRLEAECRIEQSGKDGPLLMRQLLFDERDTNSGRGTAPRNLQGAVLFFDPLLVVIAKDTATRLPRIYWLSEFREGFAGEGIEAAFLTDPAEERTYRRSRYLLKRMES